MHHLLTLHFPAMEPRTAQETVLDVRQPGLPQLAAGRAARRAGHRGRRHRHVVRRTGRRHVCVHRIKIRVIALVGGVRTPRRLTVAALRLREQTDRNRRTRVGTMMHRRGGLLVTNAGGEQRWLGGDGGPLVAGWRLGRMAHGGRRGGAGQNWATYALLSGERQRVDVNQCTCGLGGIQARISGRTVI